VTRADLPPAAQAVQAAHAALAFAVTHPGHAAAWSRAGGFLILLAAPDEAALHDLAARAAGCPAAAFREPDLGGALTAVAVHGAGRLCARYPLAFPAGRGGENMTFLKRVPAAAPAVPDLAGLRAELAETRAERDALRAQLKGDLPSATAWLQAKVWRQRSALDLANQALARQRFALALLGRIREPVTAAEWRAARNALASEQHRDRIGGTVPA